MLKNNKTVREEKQPELTIKSDQISLVKSKTQSYKLDLNYIKKTPKKH